MPNCYLKGNRVEFTNNEFIASGGQGDVYGRRGIAYKIYHDPSGMIPVKKIEELKVLDLSTILGPKDVLYSAKGKAIGFTMPLVNGTVALCRLFANSFRRIKNITPEMSVKLVEAMINVTQFIHDKKCLVADGNENNYLVDENNLVTPFFIDVDNYCTPSFKAEYLNPSVRDYQADGFSKITDWYALAIVACQVFVGIHPFKGRHSSFDTNDLVGRMKKNISIFNKAVTVPSPTRDYSNIPSEYLAWFLDLFEKGKRIPPPKVVGLLNVRQVTVQIAQTTLKFITSLLHAYDANIVHADQRDNKLVVITQNGKVWVEKVEYKLPTLDCGVILFDGDPIAVSIEKGMLKLTPLTSRSVVSSPIAAERFTIVGNTLYIKQWNKLIEIGITRLGDKMVVTTSAIWEIMPLSSVLYDSVILQNTLGKMWAVIPQPGKCHMMALPELDGIRIASGKCVENVCMFTGYKKHRLTCFQFFFSEKFDKYVYFEQPTDYLDVNFTVLSNKATIQWDGQKMFIIHPNLKMDVIEDKDLPGGMTLLSYASKLLFFEGKDLYHITSKSGSHG